MREIIDDVFGGFLVESAGGRSSNSVFHVVPGATQYPWFPGRFASPSFSKLFCGVGFGKKNNDRLNLLKKTLRIYYIYNILA